MRGFKMKKLKLGVLGAHGRMGLELLKCAEGSSKLTPYLGIDRNGKSHGYKNTKTDFNNEESSQVDLWIDFSTPEFLTQSLPILAKMKKPLVSGTTGLSDIQFKKLQKLSDQLPVLWSSNMSLGIAALTKALECLSAFEATEFQIEEIHHRNKKDAPSGTALSLQKKLEKVVQKSCPTPLSIRGGQVFGVHKVWAFADGEYLCFEHTATSRTVFAQGALFAAEKLSKKPKGFYSLADLLK